MLNSVKWWVGIWEVRDLDKLTQDELIIRLVWPFLSISMHMRFSMLKLQQLNYELNSLLNHEILIPVPKRNQSKRAPIKQNAQSFKVCVRELKLPLVAFWVFLLDREISDTASYYKLFFFSVSQEIFEKYSSVFLQNKNVIVLTVCSKQKSQLWNL